MTTTGRAQLKNAAEAKRAPLESSSGDALASGVGAPLFGGPTPPPIPREFGSNWGLQSFTPQAVPPLSFEPFGILSAEGAKKIEDFVRGLPVTSDSLVLFRGQKSIESTVSHLPPSPEEQKRITETEVSNAVHWMKQELENHRRSAVMLPGNETVKRWGQFYESARELDAFARFHKQLNLCKTPISATRSLRVAAGDYFMRTTCNDNRFIVILVAPKDRLLNFHRMDVHQDRAVFQGLKASAVGEQEIALWQDATPFVVGVYDAKDDCFLTREQIEALQSAPPPRADDFEATTG